MSVKKKAIALIGDIYHSADYIHDGLESIAADADVIFEYVTDPDDIKWEELNKYSVFVLAKLGAIDPEKPDIWMNKEYERILVEYAKSGGSIIVIHSGLPNYQIAKDYRYMVKGHFLHHPEGQQNIIIRPVSDYSGLTVGIREFEIIDEQYFVECDEKDTHVFLEGESDGYGKCAAGWAHEYGTGKICCVSPGHTLEVLSHPMMQKVMINAIRWCTNQ